MYYIQSSLKELEDWEDLQNTPDFYLKREASSWLEERIDKFSNDLKFKIVNKLSKEQLKNNKRVFQLMYGVPFTDEQVLVLHRNLQNKIQETGDYADGRKEYF